MPNDGAQGGQQQGQQGGQQQGGDQGGQQQGQQGGQQQAAPWHGIPETDTAGLEYVKNKGWAGPADVIKSYQGAEKLIGRDPNSLLVLPRADDADGQRALLAKLGRPEKPDAYDMKAGLPKEAKVDETFAKAMQGFFHEADLLPSQATKLVTAYNKYALAQQEQTEKDYTLNVQADKQALQDEWRGGFDRMMGRAQAAAKTLGFTPELVDAIEKHVGYAKTYKLLAEMGGKLGEDNLRTPDSKTPGFEGKMTPDEAKAEWGAKQLDPNFMAALKDKTHPGHKTAQETQTKLFAIMYPA
jgi:hypothetical protein